MAECSCHISLAELERYAGRIDTARKANKGDDFAMYLLGARDAVELMMDLERGNTEEHFYSRLKTRYRNGTGMVIPHE